MVFERLPVRYLPRHTDAGAAGFIRATSQFSHALAHHCLPVHRAFPSDYYGRLI